MKKFLVLTKVLLKTGVGGGVYEDDGKKKSKIKKNILYIFLAVCMAPAVIMMGYLGYAGYNLFEGANTHIILSLVCYMGVLVTFMLGITMCVGIFFGSSDINILLPLPIKPEHIVGAKFVTLYVYTVVTDALLLAPVFIGYGVAGEMSALYYIMAATVLILMPITPLVYGSIITMIIIRIFKGVRNKELLTVVTTLFTIVLVIVINTFTNSLGTVSQEEMMAMVMEKGTSIVGVMSKIFPNIVFADKALAGNVVNLLLFIASTAAFVVVFLLVAKVVYLKSVVEMSDTVSKSKKLTNVELKKASKKQSKVWAYTVKELKLAFRTPIYMLNCISLSIVWPLIILIPAIGKSIGGAEEAGDAGTLEAIAPLFESNQEMLAGICMALSFVVVVFSTAFCMLNSTTISREGKNVFFMKYIPMSYEDQLKAKILPGIIISLVTGTLYTIIGIIVISIMYGLKIPVPALLLSIVISVLACVFFNIVEIIPDIIKPKLVWETEQAAVKQNFMSIIPMFVIMIFGMAGTIGLVIIKLRFDVSVYLLALALIAVLVIGIILLYMFTEKLAKKRFAEY